jgi:hypothetical protein
MFKSRLLLQVSTCASRFIGNSRSANHDSCGVVVEKTRNRILQSSPNSIRPKLAVRRANAFSIRGQAKIFQRKLGKISSDPTILNCIEGYKIKFLQTPFQDSERVKKLSLKNREILEIEI